MDTFSIEKYQPKHKLLWDRFIATSKNATFLFNRDFMEYHQDRFEDFSLLVFKGEKLMAVLPANLVGNEVHSHQGLSYGGLALNEETRLQDVSEGFKQLLKFLNDSEIKSLHLKLLPKFYNSYPSDEMDYLLFILNANNSRRDITQVIDFSKRRKVSSSNRKRGLQRALKNGLTVKESFSFDDFWDEVLAPNLQSSFGVEPVHSLEEINLLQSKFTKNIKQYNVYEESSIVAGVTIFETEFVAHAQYISANKKGQKIGALDLLFHELIENIYKEKHFFDFGISNENKGKNINSGLLSWKESFGTSPIVHDFYIIETKNSHLLNDVFK
ncbi:GNAT family N-acetyltransferase [Subsaxibacter sp. CAU 1640]|uniref:GNAT family N-acetyltransferase n=1 Tax=Subsaxibacter sp. CAU 1640 TaxID=2933271 RepID=UPI0020058DE1|nr:GNAT family N-acetyltransferase [Subsaxibacter sp. CAU 1640]MCK7591502.1 GNAT family N-acetyltransferase [Subsaxibacter sp. CAU 1640]